ncbi:MAG: methyltransferase domain-containing protein [Methanomassiliicoccales archaeon]|nr:methyltransferase domain-containing protein [Methanomassiliicoccales archaeon]
MERRPYLFELSGEHPTLPEAEVRATVQAEVRSPSAFDSGPGYVVSELDRSEMEAVAERLALTHRIGSYQGSCMLDELTAFASSLELPEGSISIRVKRYRGRGEPELANVIIRKAGEVLSAQRKIDLQTPDLRLRILLADRLHFFLEEREIDKDQYEKRHVRSRPYFSPISLHPRYARALVNLTRVRRGQTLLDPFCGTGGVLLEASLVGAKALGSDISPEMIDGCAENLRHFNVPFERLEVADIGDLADVFGTVDAVATDPPYGRSASTRKEQVRELHERALRSISGILSPGSWAGVVFPRIVNFPDSLSLEETHSQRVHRSLTREYCIFKRR